MSRLSLFVFLSSFVLGFLALLFGSRALIEYYDFFPPDPYSDDPLTWRNVLNNAWGVRRKSLLEQQLENDPEFLRKYTVTMDDMKIPIAIAVVLGCTAVAAFFALSKKAPQKPVLSPDTWQEFILVEKTAVSPNTAIYKFALSNPNDILGLPIGQHISIQAEINGKNIMRSYTPISSDDDRGHFKLLVKAYEKGNISRYLSLLTLGQTVRVKGPKGQFKYAPGVATHLGMIAGGTGITPMLQIIRAIMKNPKDKTKVSLIYANVGFEDILLKSELDELVLTHPEKFEVYYVLNNPPAQGWNGGVGFVTKDMIANKIPAPKSTLKLLMCGPPPMTEIMKKYAVELGFEQPRTVSKLVDQTFVF